MSDSQYGSPLLVDGTTVHALERLPVNISGEYDEAYIQDLAFNHPSSLPVSEIDKAFDGLVPVCKELSTPAGPLDILYVTKSGRLAIVEAKLWRNPEARRKVIGQILDYAKELSKWSYEDLQREVSKATGKKGNVLFDLVKDVAPETQEAEFVDEISKTLSKGRFLLLILGDGIREGAAAIANFLEDVGQLEFTFGMVELALYRTPDSKLLVQPRVLAKTVIFKRLVISTEQSGVILSEAQESDEEIQSKSSSSAQDELQLFYMRFWPEWLGELQLDDPSQPFPKNKSSPKGNVFFPLPPSGGQAWVTIYFYQQPREVGAFVTFTKGEFANIAYKALLEQKDQIESELEFDVSWVSDGEKHKIAVSKNFDDLRSDSNRDAIKDFFSKSVNGFVNAFRPRLQRIVDSQ